MTRLLIPISLLTIVAACGSNDEALVVDGSWCGKKVSTIEACQGDEVGYLQATQTGEIVIGQMCEAYEKDCYTIDNGKISGGKLTFYYTFDPERVDAEFILSGSTLTGTLHSTKCDCDIPMTLHRL